MKKLYENVSFYTMIFTLCMLGLTSCQEYKIDSQQWDDTLRMEIDARDTYTALGTSPADIVFNISSNTPWSISSDEQWCKPTPAMSAASSLTAAITVTLESNRALAPRTAKLTIKGEGITEERVITITQEPKSQFEILPYEGIVSIAGETIQFGIISNKSWRVSTISEFLMDMDKRSGEGSENDDPEYISITVPANTGAKRTGTITVKTELDERSFTITQDGYYIEVTEGSPILFSEEGEEKIVTVDANVEWAPEISAEYASFIAAEKLSDSELKIVVKENSRFVPRTGKVEIVGKDATQNLGTTVEVSQQNVRFTLPAGYFLDDNGNVRISSGNIVSKYTVKKGHLTFEFEEINLTDKAGIKFNMYTANTGDNGSYNYFMNPGNNVQNGLWSGGSMVYHAYETFPCTHQEANAIRKVEFYIEENETDPSKINIRLLIDGDEKVTLKDRANVWRDSATYPKGMTVNLLPQNFAAGDYFVIKSISYEPYE